MFNSNGDIVRDPQAFEAFLIEQGYVPARAHAITTKGFVTLPQPANTPAIADVVGELECRRQALEAKASRIDVYEGQTVRQERFYSIAHEWVAVSITPKDRDVSFDALVYYHFWTENGPVARDALLYGDGRRGRFNARLRVRDGDASWLERILGGPRGGLLKRLNVEIKAHRGSTSYDVRLG
ncbi:MULTISPECIES: hypothetical protein [Kordiimonas]|jgi:hypothetical protein|uniref:hypothetical protein n=1 Tax=Kordiimonas TaxID=288021 RepID=UPI00257C6C18|nr:hypothetical protein [Kordiimonas sp. UBA4487]